MIWWFLILGVSTLVVVCVAIALYVHLRHNLQKAHGLHDGIAPDSRTTGRTDSSKH
jgi:hypothetical protein